MLTLKAIGMRFPCNSVQDKVYRSLVVRQLGFYQCLQSSFPSRESSILLMEPIFLQVSLQPAWRHFFAQGLPRTPIDLRLLVSSYSNCQWSRGQKNKGNRVLKIQAFAFDACFLLRTKINATDIACYLPVSLNSLNVSLILSLVLKPISTSLGKPFGTFLTLIPSKRNQQIRLMLIEFVEILLT